MNIYIVYFLVAENKLKTYVGVTSNLSRRLQAHKAGKVKSTIKFGDFKHYILEQLEGIERARNREKYWKSSAGRKKLKKIYNVIIK